MFFQTPLTVLSLSLSLSPPLSLPLSQGVNRSAAVTIAYLMASRGCTLEDAFFFLESVRPATQPARHFLKQLSNYEAEVFGKKISNLDDLEF